MNKIEKEFREKFGYSKTKELFHVHKEMLNWCKEKCLWAFNKGKTNMTLKEFEKELDE